MAQPWPRKRPPPAHGTTAIVSLKFLYTETTVRCWYLHTMDPWTLDVDKHLCSGLIITLNLHLTSCRPDPTKLSLPYQLLGQFTFAPHGIVWPLTPIKSSMPLCKYTCRSCAPSIFQLSKPNPDLNKTHCPPFNTTSHTSTKARLLALR